MLKKNIQRLMRYAYSSQVRRPEAAPSDRGKKANSPINEQSIVALLMRVCEYVRVRLRNQRRKPVDTKYRAELLRILLNEAYDLAGNLELEAVADKIRKAHIALDPRSDAGCVLKEKSRLRALH